MNTTPFRTGPTALALLFLATSVAHLNADAVVDILPIGDSLTKGSNGVMGAPDRATYRPYLWQTATNYLNNLPTTNGVSINFIGTESTLTAVTPVHPAESVIPIDAGWDKSHEGIGGATAQTIADPANNAFIGKALDALDNTGQIPDVATIILGTNDLAILNNGSTFNRSRVMDAVNDVETIASILRDGHAPLGVAANPDIKVLIAAIPPVDERQRYLGTTPPAGTPVNTFLWTEADRLAISGAPIASDFVKEVPLGSGNFELETSPSAAGALASTDSNHIIGVINDLLEELANDVGKDPGDNWIFVDPFDATFLVEDDGDPIAVDGGGVFDTTGTGTASNPDLVDGLHMSFTGDQYYAGNFWDAPGGVRSILDAAIAAQAIPEPSSLAFLGIVAVGSCLANRYRRSARGLEKAS